MTNLTKLFSASLLMVASSLAQASGGDKHEEPKDYFYQGKVPHKEMATRLAAAELVEPKALSTVTGTEAALKWNAVAGATSYRVQVATDPNFKWLIAQEDFYKDTTFQVRNLEAGKNYFWRVYAWNPEADPQWMSGPGSQSSFTVK